uniref:Uncharacterized protein n=1 Tax=Cucumis melo TaxID=3656 RepID=A0A9I9E6A6_CUCME
MLLNTVDVLFCWVFFNYKVANNLFSTILLSSIQIYGKSGLDRVTTYKYEYYVTCMVTEKEK